MESNVLLSIIVPIYNSALFLKRCVESVYAQDLDSDHFELLLIDDGSTDDSLKVCKDLRSRHNNIKVYAKENGGQATARNLGLEHAQGKYVMFLDSDDLLVPNTVSQLLRVAEEKQSEITIGSMKKYYPNGSFKIANDFIHQTLLVSGKWALLNGLNLGTVCGRLFLRSFIEEHHIKFTEGMRHEDVMFSMKAALQAERIISIEEVIYIYLWRNGSTDRSFDKDNLRSSLLSNLRIIQEMRKLSLSNTLSLPLKEYFYKKSNSIIIGDILTIIRRWKQHGDLWSTYYMEAKRMELLPISAKGKSWRAKFLIFVINYRYWIGSKIK